jgi:hypothetical protein
LPALGEPNDTILSLKRKLAAINGMEVSCALSLSLTSNLQKQNQRRFEPALSLLFAIGD